MSTNIAIKSRVKDFARIKAIAEDLASSPGELIEQEDIFFEVPRGRLKLRIFSSFSAELIYYERADRLGPKESRYSIPRSSEPDALRAILQRSLGIRGIVKKQRILYLVGQTRIHLDEVGGVGSFVGLEVVMQNNQSPAEGAQIGRGLMTQLEIRDSDLVEQAYIDLLQQVESAN